MLQHHFTAAQREQQLALLTEAQRAHIERYIQHGRTTIFEQFMRNEQVTAIRSTDDIALQDDELHVSDWTICQFVDYGEHNLAGKCACGRSLRYEFTVEHMRTKKQIRYGKEHLSQFLNIHVRDVDALLQSVQQLDAQLDELLYKRAQRDFGYDVYEQLLDTTAAPHAIATLIELELPLLDYQRRQLLRLFHTQIEERLATESQHIASHEHTALVQAQQQAVALASALQKEQQAMQQTQQQTVEQLMQQRFQEAMQTIQTSEAELGQVAYTLVRHHINSALHISKLLTPQFSPTKRTSIGVKARPFLYFDVLVALERYVAQGLLIKGDASNIDDCYYYSTDAPPQEPIEHEETEQPPQLFQSEQQTLF